MDDLPRTKLYRFLEIIPGLLSWSILILPVVLARWYPRAVAIFVAVYVVIWFLRYVKSSFFFVYSFFKNNASQQTDWIRMMNFFSKNPPNPESKLDHTTVEKIAELKKTGTYKGLENVYHLVIIATYKEEKDILEPTLEALANVDYPKDKLIVVLATEERDRSRAEDNVAYLTPLFEKRFGQFFHFMHPKDMPNEIPAKGGNITFACKQMVEILKKQGVDFSDVLVTTLDADNRPHPAYFSNLTYHYLLEPKRKKRSFQPLPFFYNNIWDVPFVNRLLALANTFWFLSEFGEGDRLFNASAHAQSLDALVEIDYWSRETIVEDIHQFWRTYFHFNGDHVVVPLFIPVYQDALQNKTYFTSLTGQYKQLRRWAWGASEIPYAFLKIMQMGRKLPFWRSLSMFIYLCYLQISWSTAPIIIYFNISLTTFLNPEFAKTLFAYNLGTVINTFFTTVLFAIVIFLSLSLLSLPRPRGKYVFWKYVSIAVQWILLPIVTITYGALPALDAQTRLMLNKPLGFTVTEKIRKIN